MRTSRHAVAAISPPPGGRAAGGRVSGRRRHATQPMTSVVAMSAAKIERQPSPAVRKPPSTGARELPSTATMVTCASARDMRSTG